MDHARPGSRRARREARHNRRQGRYGRFLGLTALGTLIPGAGLLAAGRKGWGRFILTLVALGVLVLAFVLWRVPRSRLAAAAFDRDELFLVGVALVVVATGWLVVAVASHRALEPDGLPAGKRLVGSLVVIAVASLVVAPMTIGARYAWTQSDLIEAVSQESSTTPDLDRHDPWADKPQVNILLLGSDGGDGREGIRPDTIILTSIDTESGDAVLFSLPRNLEKVPFPVGTPLHERFPHGFTNHVPTDPDYLLNAVYKLAPAEVGPEAFAGSSDPGADATKLAVSGALGLEVDYYVMADLRGFQDIVNAMDGITIDVNYPVPMGTRVDNGRCVWAGTPDRWILPGKEKKLSGGEALWFARARCAPYHPDHPESSGTNSPVRDDYNRMERQRCVIAAMADRADPISMLPRFMALAAAAENTVKTDIPQELFPAFAELALRVQRASIRSLAFTNQVIPDRTNPDYIEVHALVKEALNPPEPEPEPTAAETAAPVAPADEEQAGDSTESEAPETEPDDEPVEPGSAGDPEQTLGSDPTEAADLAEVC